MIVDKRVTKRKGTKRFTNRINKISRKKVTYITEMDKDVKKVTILIEKWTKKVTKGKKMEKDKNLHKPNKCDQTKAKF